MKRSIFVRTLCAGSVNNLHGGGPALVSQLRGGFGLREAPTEFEGRRIDPPSAFPWCARPKLPLCVYVCVCVCVRALCVGINAFRCRYPQDEGWYYGLARHELRKLDSLKEFRQWLMLMESQVHKCGACELRSVSQGLIRRAASIARRLSA